MEDCEKADDELDKKRIEASRNRMGSNLLVGATHLVGLYIHHRFLVAVFLLNETMSGIHSYLFRKAISLYIPLILDPLRLAACLTTQFSCSKISVTCGFLGFIA